MLLRRLVPMLALIGELPDLLVDGGLIGIDRQPLQLQSLDLRRRNVRQRFDLHADLGVLARLIFLVELDLRLESGTDVLLREKLLHAVLHRAVERIAA